MDCGSCFPLITIRRSRHRSSPVPADANALARTAGEEAWINLLSLGGNGGANITSAAHHLRSTLVQLQPCCITSESVSACRGSRMRAASSLASLAAIMEDTSRSALSSFLSILLWLVCLSLSRCPTTLSELHVQGRSRSACPSLADGDLTP